VLAYLAAMFPGCYLVGRRAPDWRLFYASFLGAAAVFSVLFSWLGQTGGGEVNRVRSVAIAQQLEDGLYNVTQWSSAGVIGGNLYDIRHGGSGRLYSTCQEIEAVHGVIGGGRFVVDMPPVSTRTVLHRARLPATHLGMQVREAQAHEGLMERFRVDVGAGFPREVEFACACYQGRIYRLAVLSGGLALSDRGQPGMTYLNRFFEVKFDRPGRTLGHPRQPALGYEPLLTEEERIFRGMIVGLIGNTFGLTDKAKPEQLMLGPDVARIFVFAPMPEAFFIEGDAFPDQKGYVLYTADVRVEGGE
jgi:hypothetical protein